jgi:hypothetical protein
MLAGVPLHRDRPPSFASHERPASVQRFAAAAASIPKEKPPAPIGAGEPETPIGGGEPEAPSGDVSGVGGAGGSASEQLPGCQCRCPAHPSVQEV